MRRGAVSAPRRAGAGEQAAAACARPHTLWERGVGLPGAPLPILLLLCAPARVRLLARGPALRLCSRGACRPPARLAAPPVGGATPVVECLFVFASRMAEQPRGGASAVGGWPAGAWDGAPLPLGARVAWPEEAAGAAAGLPLSWASHASNPLAAYSPEVLADMLLLDSAHAARCVARHAAPRGDARRPQASARPWAGKRAACATRAPLRERQRRGRAATAASGARRARRGAQRAQRAPGGGMCARAAASPQLCSPLPPRLTRRRRRTQAHGAPPAHGERLARARRLWRRRAAGRARQVRCKRSQERRSPAAHAPRRDPPQPG
jgi:hypothetical protein